MTLLLATWRKLTVLSAHPTDGAFPAMAVARPIRRLAGSTVGLIDFGALGRAVARKLSGFDLACRHRLGPYGTQSRYVPVRSISPLSSVWLENPIRVD